MRKQTTKWTMRDGAKIRICDMSDSHIYNTMNMLERVAKKEYNHYEMLALDMEATTEGDMCQMIARNALHELAEKSWESFLPDIYWKMRDDLERRSGLN